METVSGLYHKLFVAPRLKRRDIIALQRIRERGVAKVGIVTSSLSMWRLEAVWSLMQKDSHFDCRIILVPFAKQSPQNQEAELQMLREYFTRKSIPFEEQDAFESFDPDIVFYQQFYSHSYRDPVRARHNEHRLLCYSPYGVMFIDRRWQYNSRFHNVAWKIFLQSEAHLDVARRLCDNHGSNVVVVGDADSDAFLSPDFVDVWKPQDKVKKRIIWAPHHKKLRRDSFEWTADIMQEIAVRYKDSVQFAFKPHPRLKTELYKEWGVEKTDAYYDFWANGENTQLETGCFINLFRGSDAMIHDCNSFLAEYIYTRKPVLFLSTNTASIRSSFGTFGLDVLNAHYQGDTADSIPHFIDEVVLGADDPLLPKREAAYEKYLKPKGGSTFSECVVKDILDSIQF